MIHAFVNDISLQVLKLNKNQDQSSVVLSAAYIPSSQPSTGSWLGLGLGAGGTKGLGPRLDNLIFISVISFPKSTIKTECQVICSEPNILTFLTQEISLKFLSC